MANTTTLILGAGFGGISAANALRRALPGEHEIIVIDQSPDFYVGAGKTWIMLGERTFDEISQRRTALFEKGIRFVPGRVARIELATRSVVVGDETLRWDYLVVALGADLNPDAVPGLAGAAHTFYTGEGAQRLKVELARFAGGEIAILIPRVPFKCPPAPYEAAMLLHHAFEHRGLAGKIRITIHTAEGAPMATAGPEMGRYITQALEERGIGFNPQRKTVRVDGAARRIAFEDGSEAGYDLLIAVPPHEAPQVVRDAQLTNASGWIPVNPQTLQASAGDAGDVYAVGDITAIALPGRYKPDVALALPKAGVFAEAHGRVAAAQIAARILGREAGETFDGKGFCYLETGAERAVKADGSFFELPHPLMQKRTPSAEQFRDKQEWVARCLRPLR